MDASVDLRAYFHRIGYTGAAVPTLQVLASLHRLHPQAIAFETLSPLLGLPVPLDLVSLQRKMVASRRGGWCFEHNLLFWAVLRMIGFEVTGLSARVLWRLGSEARPPRSHMLLQVKLAGTAYLADVGFGGLTLTAPLRLQTGLVQSTPHGDFELRETSDGLSLWAHLPEREAVLYRFDMQPQQPEDYEYANWFLATHPASAFADTLMAARSDPGGRHTLRNGQYGWHPLNGAVAYQRLSDVIGLRQVLLERFGLQVPASPQADARLAAVLQN